MSNYDDAYREEYNRPSKKPKRDDPVQQDANNVLLQMKKYLGIKVDRNGQPITGIPTKQVFRSTIKAKLRDEMTTVDEKEKLELMLDMIDDCFTFRSKCTPQEFNKIQKQ